MKHILNGVMVLLAGVMLVFVMPTHAFNLKSLLTGSPQKEFQCARASDGVRIETDNPGYPLEFIEDCYKFMRYFEKPVINRKTGALLYKEKKAEWRWRYKVKNKSSKILVIHVTYKLIDEDEFVLSESREKEIALPNDIIILSGEIVLDKNLADKVTHRSWTIRYE